MGYGDAMTHHDALELIRAVRSLHNILTWIEFVLALIFGAMVVGRNK